ncbi:MAG: pirin-like C-terminal cupin domain-containing protein [Ramlibacter sp.]
MPSRPCRPATTLFCASIGGELAVLDEAGQATPVARGRMAILSGEGDGVVLQGVAGSESARALLIAGKPLREPIAQYGPFVMNTREQLLQPVQDFQSGRLRRAPA